MSRQREYKDALKIALGTPETVNFKALHILLSRIIEALLILYKQTGITSPHDQDGKYVDSRRSSLVLASPGVDASVVEAPEKKQSVASRKKSKISSAHREEDGPSKYRASKIKLASGKTAKKSPADSPETKKSPADIPETKRPKRSKTCLREEKDVKLDESDYQIDVHRSESDTETIDAKDDAEGFEAPLLQDGLVEVVVPSDGSLSFDTLDADEVLASVMERLEAIEADLLEIKTLENEKKKTSTSPSQVAVNLDSKVVVSKQDLPENVTASVQKLEDETNDRLKDLWATIKKIQKQLLIMPEGSTIYRSFFPSWKMLESAICSPATLESHLESAISQEDPFASHSEDIWDHVEDDEEKELLTKFLGIPGPTGRLLNILQKLGQLAEEDVFNYQPKESPQSVHVKAQDGPEVMDTYGAKVDRTVSEVVDYLGAQSGKAVLNLRMVKMTDDINLLQIGMDEMQTWKERITELETNLTNLDDEIKQLAGEFVTKSQKDQEIFTNMHLDLNELSLEVSGVRKFKQLESTRAGLADFRSNLQEERLFPETGLIMDREARIRTQQLTMQVNLLHTMINDLAKAVPAFQFSTPITSALPETMRHPWGSGRDGIGAAPKPGGSSGLVIAGDSVKMPRQAVDGAESSVTAPQAITMDVTGIRPQPIGYGKEADGDRRAGKSPERVGPIQVMLRPIEDKDLVEEKNRMQQAITRVSSELRRLGVRTDTEIETRTKEFKMLKEMCYRFHTELMNRYDFIDEELARQKNKGVMLTEVNVMQPNQSGLESFKSEVYAQLENIIKRLQDLEDILKDRDGALLKRPIFQRFQCLSCDKPIDIMQLQDQLAPVMTMPPELPRLPPIPSPQRYRVIKAPFTPTKQNQDTYEIPRNCGGSYTATTKPRRVQYYSNLSEVLDEKAEPTNVIKVNMKGTDGQIYKGHLMDKDENISQSKTPRNRFEQLIA